MGIRLGGRPLGAELLVEASPGLALTRPVLYMAGVGVDARVTLAIGQGWDLFAGAGMRLTVCPAYEALTGAPYALLDAPVSLGARWTIARE